MDKTYLMWSAVVMFLGVGAGAFGAHGLSAYFDQYSDLKETYLTAVRYHLIHGLALLAMGWIRVQFPGNLTTSAGILFLVGLLLFSGSLYLLVFTRLRWLGMITPLGGLAFLAGWAVLFLAALQS